MSENRNRGNHDFSEYDSMTTEELEAILRLDAEAPIEQESDTELLLYVMGVLANRKNHVTGTGKTALEAWESFRQNYLPAEEECLEYTPEQQSERMSATWLRHLIATVAVIALVVCIPLTANAFGWEDIWNTIAQWAKETFSFVDGEQIEDNVPNPKDFEEYSSLQQILLENNRDPHIAPVWVPEEALFESVEKEITPIQEIYTAFYRIGERPFRIRIQSYSETDPEKIEINEDLTEIYESNGVEYYIFTNNKQMQAVWINDSYECYISGELTIEEIKQMIDSIEKG